MKLYIVYLIIFTLLLITGITACKSIGNQKKMEKKLKNVEEISCRYGDASVPPPFHRSYSIVVNKDTMHFSIDSYGSVLAEKSYATPDGCLEKIAESFLKNKVASRKEKKENDGCTGGTTKSIAFSVKGEKEAFSASAYYCGDKIYGSLVGEVDSFFTDMKNSIPDFKEVLASTRQ